MPGTARPVAVDDDMVVDLARAVLFVIDAGSVREQLTHRDWHLRVRRVLEDEVEVFVHVAVEGEQATVVELH